MQHLQHVVCAFKAALMLPLLKHSLPFPLTYFHLILGTIYHLNAKTHSHHHFHITPCQYP